MSKKAILIRVTDEKHSILKLKLVKNKETMQSVLEKLIDDYICEGGQHSNSNSTLSK